MSGFQLESVGPEDLCAELPTDAAWPRTLAELMESLLAEFRRAGVPEDKALELAERGAIAIGQHQGGRPVYLPRGDALLRAARDRRIFLENNGRNHEALMAKYKIGTLRRLQQIIAEQSAIHVRRVQGDLFTSSDAA